MAIKFFGRSGGGSPILEISNLDIYYGKAHAVQGVSLSLQKGVLGVVGKNGMGKTSLCNAITGLVPARGSIKLAGEEILGLPPHAITAKGIGYVPQGRRVWPSLSVDEHLRLAAKSVRGGELDRRAYLSALPRLGERKNNGGSQLSGGEQQMLAIGRALLFNPRLLVMDEPTEGLAPVIVEHVADTLKTLASEGNISVLLIEQNLGVAVAVADNVAVMVNGRIARTLPARELASDVNLQHQLLGVRQSADDEASAEAVAAPAVDDEAPVRVFTVARANDNELPRHDEATDASRTVRNFNRWNQGATGTTLKDLPLGDRPSDASFEPSSASAEHKAQVFEFSVAHTANRAAYIAGTFDTKGRELFFLKNCMEKLGLRTVTVEFSTSGKPSPANIHPREVARCHPKGERGVFTDDRGTAVTGMALAFENFIVSRRDLGGLISAGGSGGTALATPAMRRLPVGVPKVMVSTVASGDVKPYVGPSDICMMYSVTDVSGINRISERVLSNAAHALAGMIAYAREESKDSKPAIGLTMFGVTTPCVQATTKLLEEAFDCLVFHATGTGGQSMEKLVDSGLIAGVIDVSTTEIADEIGGGVLSAGTERMDAIIRSRIPYVGTCGALDMVNFWARDTVPSRLNDRLFYQHNANVTLMRTTVEENIRIGEFIAGKLNQMEGPVRFILPMGGVSALDAPGKAFWNPDADNALFQTIEKNFRPGSQRRLIKSPLHLNDPQFAEELAKHFHELNAQSGARRRAL